ncbi:MAG TPA: protein kinase [Gemmatimonadales bacterium]|nr:protein kinase [Gemmatimonadales bacterium]
MTDIPARLAAALADRYRLDRELGQGGMATVYLAQDLKHDRRVAIKVLRPELAAVLGAERFVQEIKTTAGLSHPHILPLFDSGEADGFLYYVMPYIQGETIREKLNRETQFGIEEAVKITTEVADALAYAHTQGVIHRDIKPENVLLHNGRPMVMDFGIALAVSAAAGGRMTETGLSLGTPHYMSPEQATADKQITARSDVYSLASVLYEMLAGEPPHTGSSAQAIIMKIVAEPVQAVTKLRKSVPFNVAAALAKALEKISADRFESARAFAEALQNPGFTTAGRPAETGVGRGRLPALPVVGGMAVGAVVLAALGWLAGRRGAGAGPVEYDVGLPETAAMWTGYTGPGFALAPSGDFVVYQAAPNGRSELWYRSLRDATVRRIPGTEDGGEPTLSPDGRRIAFLKTDADVRSVVVLPVEGGTATTLGRATVLPSLQWLPDGRIQLIDNSGNRVRWFDSEGGPAKAANITFCIVGRPIPSEHALLCGSAIWTYAYLSKVDGSLGMRRLWQVSPDTAPVVGSDFQLVDGRYLVYVSVAGDLLAAPVQLKTGRVGRAVRMEARLARHEASGTGAYAISASGTLVYAQGDDRSIGNLVHISAAGVDTLSVGREAFLTYEYSPDGRRLAALVEVVDGMELRIYDLASGRYQTWFRRPAMTHAIWSPQGDRLLFGVGDSIFVGSPDRSDPPEFLLQIPRFEAMRWMPGDRVYGSRPEPNAALVLRLDRRPVTADSLFSDTGFLFPSADERWIAYANQAYTEAWIEPLPRDGRRFLAASGNLEDIEWLSPLELGVPITDGGRTRIERVTVDAGANPPVRNRGRWADAPEFRDTNGPSFATAPGGGLIYMQGAVDRPVPYLRVVPRWVDRMKRAVDEANR